MTLYTGIVYHLRTPTKPSLIRRRGNLYRRIGSSAAARQSWEKWVCFPGLPTARTAGRSCTITELPHILKSRRTISAQIIRQGASVPPIISGPWCLNSLCFKICRGWLPMHRMTRMRLYGVS